MKNVKIQNLDNFNLGSYLKETFLNEKNQENEKKVSDNLFISLLTEEDKNKIKEYKNFLEDEEKNNNFTCINQKEEKFFTKKVESIKEIKNSKDTFFLIYSHVWFENILNQDYYLRKLIEKKKINYSWIGNEGVLINAENLKKLLFFIIKERCKVKIKFDENINNKKLVYYKKVFILSINNEKNELDFFNLPKRKNPYEVYNFYINSKYLRERKENKKLEELEKNISIKKFKIQQKELKKQSKYVNINQINDYFNLKNTFNEYADILRKLGYLYINDEYGCKDYIDDLHVELFLNEETNKRDLYLNIIDLMKVLKDFNIEEEKINNFLNTLGDCNEYRFE